MPSPCSSLWLFLFLRNLIVDTPAAAEMIPNATTPSCPSYRCGHAVDIRYPFWIDDNTSAAGSYCGYPSLRLECRRDTPVLPLPSGEYAVTHILYSDRTVSLFDVGVFSRSNTCPLVGRNLSLPAGSPLSLTARDTNLTFFVHCSFMGMPAHLVACLEGDGRHHSYVFRDGDDRTPYGYAGLCQDVVSMPVLRRSLLGGNNSLLDAVVVPALNMGFELSWRPPREDGECGDCEKAGGWCGHRRRAAHEPWTFTCFRTATTATRAGTKSPTPGSKGNRRTIGIALGAGGGILAIIIFSFVWHKHKKRKQSRDLKDLMRSTSSMQSYSKDLELGGSPHIFTYEELEKATDGFSASRELGDGGFGTVYKGKLQDGRVVAVKRLYKNNYRRVEQFVNEVDILSRLLHQNLVTLYGCTSRSSHDLLLVYEFIPNGTVADHLHGPRAAERGLTWPARMTIAIETAEALAYLHAVEIIHRDVKTNNILLDNSFHVKVADFGLSRLFPLEVTHVSTVPQGTPGYVDPVYHQCYKLTDKSDVYSFGVVLVELISSKPAVDMSRSHSDINLASMALNRIQNHEVDQLVDPELGYETDSETKRMIDLVAELAFQCLQLDRDNRPPIKEVVAVLHCIKNGECPAKMMNKDASPKEDSHLLKDNLQYSPDSVIHRFHSQSTNHSVASNSSG
ncbi:LEAF RUST 10 DISEASE-RESISTANCE LOCUS RECEPTOR-LIKE PROTEIN KINASE-like 1.2 isoform X2 [Oryza brachyantha]|uniref:LEAF RUST 10 DISEASE-RESISTANCE LOCUS RECEPTOR-LIKE PROTEIN KINASE-like 1.2 isoform X2 n=1 Tax=Oryza brachyantha TaxID=4533 RepID=UPI001ADAD75A|nr:LEAF RUST 10 DISEASE-RESISTANCE LOCUS RECEPTOR-LIKE PROTEIN KINASE-like 1.2 isoform X2 [Oryza brachyantha]